MSNFYGLIGEKLGHSLSPRIHAGVLDRINEESTYSLFEIKRENLAAAVAGMKAMGCRGANVTIPYKIDVMKCLDRIVPEAERIGAINTIAFTEDGLVGYNTDYYGFGLTLRQAGIEVGGKSAVILGPGGAAKAVVEYLLDNGISEVTFVSRDPEKASDKIKGHRIISYAELESMEDKDIIINCTPCGMHPATDASPVSRAVVEKFSTAVDLIYNPVETLFLREAREAGLTSANGLFMLVGQAAAAQEIWHGEKFSEAMIKDIYNELSGS
jgi:shikimate dehydrogenase